VARPTLVSVARDAGVSRQTVSNALNAPDRVAPETLARVLDVVERTGYRPSRAAQQLRTQRAQSLGFRLQPRTDGIGGTVLDAFLHALTEAAQDVGHRVVLFTAADDAQETTRVEDLLGSRAVDGFVLTGTHRDDARTAWLAGRGVPHTSFGRPWPAVGAPAEPPTAAGAEGCWTDVDGAAGTEAATRHVWALGHRRVAFVGWPAGSGSGDDRRAGWARAVRDLTGRAPSPRDDARVEDGAAPGRAAVLALLDAPSPPTAVVCASDSLALGARAAAVERRAALDVVGFDDTPVAEAVGLTSVRQPLDAAAASVLEQLLALVDGEQPPVPRRLLAPSLAVRRPGG